MVTPHVAFWNHVKPPIFIHVFVAKEPLGVEGWDVLLHRSDHLSSVIAASSDHGGFPIWLVAPKAHVFQLEPGLRYQLTCYGTAWKMDELGRSTENFSTSPFCDICSRGTRWLAGKFLGVYYMFGQLEVAGHWLNVEHKRRSKGWKQGSSEICISHSVYRVNHNFNCPHHMVALDPQDHMVIILTNTRWVCSKN